MPTKRPKIAAPIIDELSLVGLADTDPSDIAARGSYEACRFVDSDLTGRDLAGIAFSECEFTGLEAHEAQFRGARFVETRLDRAHAAVFQAARTTWRSVHINNSRFGAVEMFDADLESVRITGSKLSFVNLRAARLRDIAFDHCVIDELDLVEARAQRIAFNNCKVAAIQLDHAQLRHVDLRGLDLSSVSGVDSMSGAIISFTQAVDLTSAFAQHLGITVAD